MFRCRLIALLVAAAVPFLAGAAPAGAPGAPPLPGLDRGQPVWLGFAVMFVLAAAVIAVSLVPSKRSHQD